MALTVLVLIMVFLSLLIHLVPGDPARIILKQRATPELIAQVRNELGLDEPVYVQLWDFLAGAFHGNLGEDFYSNRPVRTIVADVLPDTLMLAASSIVLSSSACPSASSPYGVPRASSTASSVPFRSSS